MRTRGGKRVVGLIYAPRNRCGDFVTFPIKGSVVRREKPLKLEYEIWTLDGRYAVFGDDHPDDLIIEE